MGLVHPCADLAKEILVAVDPREFPVVEEIDELRVETGLRQREQGVEEDEARVGQLAPVCGGRSTAAREVHHAGAVGGAHDIAEAVGLDDVAELGVDDEAADHRVGVETEVGHRPTVRDQERLEARIGALLPGADPVVDQGVVHVVADGLDRSQVEGPVGEDPAGEGGLRWWCGVRTWWSPGKMIR